MGPVTFDVGDIVDGRYQLVRDIGRGAAAIVFEARHLFTGRFVAVKMILPASRGANVPKLRARLQREGQALASIRHAGVVDVLDGGVTHDGSPYLVIEMLEGRTLEGLIATRGGLPIASSVSVALQLCDALDAVHRAGVVHRDVKPANVIVVKDAGGCETVKLVDFGVAKVDSQEKLTGDGMLVGTAAYMAPELLVAEEFEADPLTDLYAVGVTLFECLSGAMPYPGNYAQVVLRAAYDKPAPTLRSVAPDVPPPLCDVVDRAIAKERTKRFRSLRDLARALEEATPGTHRRTNVLAPPAPDGAEQRRRTTRVPYNTPVRLVLPEGGTIDGRTEDISETGALVLAFTGATPGPRVGLRFALPMDGKVSSVEAEVRWVRTSQQPGSWGMRAIGLAFVEPPVQTRASIARYVELMTTPARSAGG